MAIPLIHEKYAGIDPHFNVIGNCHFCGKFTRWWHENTNNPVCKDCAKLHKVEDLPDFGQAIRARNRSERKG